MVEKDNPWKITGTREYYDNPWINVTQYDVINPSGRPGIYGKVHFKNVAVGIVALDSDDHIWLLGQFRFVLGQYSWEIPEGGCPEDEVPLDCARRELAEETGLVAGRWDELLTLHLSNSVTDEWAVVYLARDLEMKAAHPEETEDLTVRKLSFNETMDLVKEGKITDAISVAALQRIQLMKLEGLL
jgi:8-oxo-dGTP pyrophosphatase MutT (NUDIX family)